MAVAVAARDAGATVQETGCDLTRLADVRAPASTTIAGSAWLVRDLSQWELT